MRFFLMMAMVFTLSFVNAQDADSFRELRERYWNSSEEARAVMDSIYSNFEESYSAEQVKTIGYLYHILRIFSELIFVWYRHRFMTQMQQLKCIMVLFLHYMI